MAPASTVPEASVDPFAAVESLRAALDAAGIVLPSLAVDPQQSTVRLIDLGRIRPDVALRLATALRREEAAA
ncbi:hypothetical protein [Streptomyces justiciae]|uniref:Uncharacterized protein n=1 Tax=Streptomyces justiciae TaxID=2780140 RepID=A0ABU3M6N5_9ACTN|nr:hypothetical protein [Streptomyces justiciae]MDT7847176.1 hypothetical protein [Streptomyces justiciae]